MPDTIVSHRRGYRVLPVQVPASRARRIFALFWLVVWIATPISFWTVGERFTPLLTTLGVLAQAVATSAGLAMICPARRIITTMLIVVGLTWLVEWVGSTTGVPFGRYQYSSILQPQVAGVPLLIPLAWWMMLGPAWAAATSILTPLYTLLGRWYGPLAALLSGAAFTAWDFYLDPQMVRLGLWTWDSPGGYFGIPWVNFLGWWLVASAISLIVQPHLPADDTQRSTAPRTALLIIYTLTWIFQAVGLGLFWRQPGPALVGFTLMGLFAVAAWLQEYRRA
jgi:putative membrane protein